MINGNNGTVGVAFPLGNRIELLTDQMGRLTELVTTGFGELKDGLSELKTIAQAQQQDINRLVGVVDRQSQTADRLALMLERLMSDRSELSLEQ